MKNDKSKRSDVLTIWAMLLIGLLIAIIIYPFLHEVGHLATSFAVGADVVKFRLLPTSYIMCNVANLTEIQRIAIGASGMALPILIALLIPQRWFWTWYVRFILLGISLIALTISVTTLLLPNGTVINPQDDIIFIFAFWHGSKITLTMLVCAIGISVLMRIIFDKPIKRICVKFGI